MTEFNLHFRRATLEDLDVLRGLWQTALYAPLELEKHLTEFQLVEGDDGRLLGALGIRISGEEAWIHHEAFTHPTTESAMRDALWHRLKIMFGNQGVHRVWTKEKADYWNSIGFRMPTSDERPKFPSELGTPDRSLKVFPLRDFKAEKIIEKKMIELQASRFEEEAQSERRTRIVRIIAWSLAGFLMVLLAYFTIRGLMILPQIRDAR
jgi:N-acetylglutamate synthase-like GNAT family acetyltransferase